MKALLICPEKDGNARSWGHKLNLQLRKKSSEPLELTEIAIELPINWERTMVDMNFEKLTKKDILKVDCIFIRADVDQEKSTKKVIDRCRIFGKRIVAVGPLFRFAHTRFSVIDHLILSEAELVRFTWDLEYGSPKPVYGLEYIRKMRRVSQEENSLVGFSGNLMRGLQLVS